MAFKVSLNGANHVSEDRKKAFERSLVEGSPAANRNGGNGKPVQLESTAMQAASVAANHISGDASSEAMPAQHHHLSVDYPRILESLERGLSQSYDHQSETLRVHQHYLSNEAAYASIFAQLMEEQGALFAGGNVSSEQAEVVSNVLNTLARSIEHFHEHQSQTLTVHSQFLDQQATYAQSFVELLEGHYGAALYGKGNGNVHSNGNGNGNGKGNGNGNGKGNGNGHHSENQPQATTWSHTAEMPASGDSVYDTVSAAVAPTITVEGRVAPPAVAARPVVASTRPTEAGGPWTDGGAIVSTAALSASLLSIVSDKTGYPAEMLELDMDMEADLGIDSIKRVEILGALQDAHPGLPEVETDALAELRTLSQVVEYTSSRLGQRPSAGGEVPEAEQAVDMPAPAKVDAPVALAQPAPVAVSGLSQDLLTIVSEKTGYPSEMLELDMDMEADLGIDSIKRVEILGALQDQHPDLPEVETDALAELRTLAQILDYMAGDRRPRAEADPKKA